VVEPLGILVRLVRRVCTDIQLLFTHLIELWTRSRAPIRSLSLHLLLRVQLALRLTLIPPHYDGGVRQCTSLHVRYAYYELNMVGKRWHLEAQSYSA
jgi:hypothetical protein